MTRDRDLLVWATLYMKKKSWLKTRTRKKLKI